jgi:hypothetical protein
MKEIPFERLGSGSTLNKRKSLIGTETDNFSIVGDEEQRLFLKCSHTGRQAIQHIIAFVSSCVQAFSKSFTDRLLLFNLRWIALGRKDFGRIERLDEKKEKQRCGRGEVASCVASD